MSKLQANTSKTDILIFDDFVKKNSSKCCELISISIAFKMAPIKQSNLKIIESIIEFYKLHSKKAMVTPIINGNAKKAKAERN